MSSNPQQDWDIGAWLEAISEQESGGNYGIQRLDKHGATGKYQILKSNIPKWTKELYGEPFTPEEFASDPVAQEEVAKYKFQQYFRQRGGNLAEVAKDWYGRGSAPPGHPTPDQYAKSILGKYEAARRRRSTAQPKTIDQYSDEELGRLPEDQLNALLGIQAPAAKGTEAMPTTKAKEGDLSPRGEWKWSNGRWVDNLGRLPSQMPDAKVDQQRLVVDPNNPQQGAPPFPEDGPGSYVPTKGQPGYTPTYGEEGYVPPSMDYLQSSQPASPAEAERRLKTQRELSLARKRTIQVPHGGKLTLQQANDSLARFVFGGSAAEARRRQAAAIEAGLLRAPLSVLTDDYGQPLTDEGRFQELIRGKSRGDSRFEQYYLPITVNEQAVAVRERFKEEAGVDVEGWISLQSERDPLQRDIKRANLERKRREESALDPFRQLAASRLSTMAPWDQPNSPEAKREWIEKTARELKEDEPLANTVLNFFNAGYDKRDYAEQGKHAGGVIENIAGPEFAALMRLFNPATPLIAAFGGAYGGEEERRMIRDGAQGLAAFFNGISFGALSDYDPRYDEAFAQLSPQQQERFLERTDVAKMTAKSAGTTAAIALLVGSGQLTGAAGVVSEAAGLARIARAANWIERTIQASGFNGMGIGSSVAQATVYAAVDEAVKTGAPSLNEWARGGGWNENASAAENLGNYLTRFTKRLPDDAAQFIIGNQFGRIAEKIAADYGLRSVAKELVGRSAEGIGEFVQEAGSQLYKGEGFNAKALMTAGMLGFVMGSGGGNADIHVVSKRGLVYKLDSKGGLELVPKGAVDPRTELIPEGAILGRAALGIDDFYVAVWGKEGAGQQQIEVQEQALGDTASTAGVTVQAGPSVAEARAHLAAAHRGYTAEMASGEAPPQSIFGSDAAVRSAAFSANEIEQQLRRDPESYIVEQEDDAKALAQVAATIRQAYEGKQGSGSTLGLDADAGTAPITDPEQLRAVKAEAIKQAALAPDGTINIERAQKVKEIVDAIGEQYTDSKGFLRALDAAVETRNANAKSIRDEFGSKIGQERRYNAEVESSAAEVSRLQQELQQLNDAQAKLNEERRVTRDAVRDAEDYATVAEDGVVEAEDAVAAAERAAEQARAPLARAMERGGVSKAGLRRLNRQVEAADAGVVEAQKGLAKAKQIAQRARQAVGRASAVDSRKQEDLQEATKAFAAKQKEFRAAQDRSARAYETKEAFIKNQKRERAEAGLAPSASKTAQTAPKAQNISATASPKAATSPKGEVAPNSETAPKEQTTSTEYAGPEVESKAEIQSQKPEVRKQFLSKPENAANIADRSLSLLEKNGGGSVYIDGSEPTKGYAVSLNMEETVDGDGDVEAAVAKYVARSDVKEALAEKPNRVVGTWTNNGKVYLDVSEILDDKQAAIDEGEIRAQLAVFDIEKGEEVDLPVGKLKRSIADRLRLDVGPIIGLHMSEQDAMDYAQILTSKVRLAAKAANRSIEDQFPIMVERGLLGIKGHSVVKVGGTEIPAHIAEDGTVTLAQRTILPEGFVNLYLTPVAVPKEGLKKVAKDEIIEKLNALVGNKIEPFELGAVEGRHERFQEWKKKVVERFADSWMVDIKEAFDMAAVAPHKFKLKGINDSASVEAGTQRDPTTREVLDLFDRGLNWYDKGKREAIANVAIHRPELRVDEDGKPVDKFAYTAFATLLGVHSPGNKPVNNGPQAIEHYVDWQAKRDEVKAAGGDPDLVLLPLVNLAGFAAVEQTFEIDGKPEVKTLMVPGAGYSRAGHNPTVGINRLAQLKFGGNIKQAIEWLHELHPRSEVMDVARQLKKSSAIELPREDMIPGSFILDTKIGAFIANLGGNFKPVTIDLWFSAGYNRHMGTIGSELARNEWEVDAMQAATEALVVRLEKEWKGRGRFGRQMREAFGPPRKLQPAEVQGLIWYIEQQIWAAHGNAAVESVSYEESTKEYADNWEKHEKRREQGRKDVQAAWLSDLYSTTSPDREALAGRGLQADKEGRVDPSVTFGASPDLRANAATVQFLIDSLAHYKSMPSIKVSQITPGEAVAWGPLVPEPVPDDGIIGPLPDKKEENARRAAYNRKVRSAENAARKELARQEAAFAKSEARLAKQREWEEGLGRPLPVNSWVVIREDAPVPHSVYDTKEEAEKAAAVLGDYRKEYQQGIVRLAGLEAQRDFLIKEIQKDSGMSREEVEAEIKNLADVHAALLPIRTELYQGSGKEEALGATLKAEIQKIASIGGAPTTDALVSILAGKPEYLSGVANYLIKQRGKLLAGEMTVRDVAKAYIITLSSMGATEAHVASKDAQSVAAGLDPEMQTGADIAGIPAQDFLSTKKGKTMIRPEDFMAKFFLTKDGQALLDHVEQVAEGKAELDEALFAPMTAVRQGFGSPKATTSNVFAEPKAGAYTLKNIAGFVEELNKAGKAGDPEAILDVVTKLKGIAEGKKGFIGQLLGFGGAATVDAVELNTWLLGKSTTRDPGEVALVKRAGRPDLAPLMRQLVENGMRTLAMDPRIASQLSQAEMDNVAFMTIMHHWLWDRMKGTETSHAGLYKAMELAHSENAVGQVLGMVGYSGMGPATIDYYVGANAATMAHEPVHVYRRFMPKADLEIAEKWVAKATGLKVHNGQWLAVHDEALARGFEQWLLEGKMPSNAPEGLKGVFERMKAAILAVYKDHDQYKAKGQVDDFVGRLDDNIRGVFERMLGLRTEVGTPSQQAALENYKNKAEQGRADFEKTYQVAGPDDEKFARDMMLTYCRWDFRRMPIADQRALLEEIFEVQRDGVSPRTKEEVLGPVFAGRTSEFRDSKVPAMGQAALQRRMAKRLDDATRMSPQFDSDAREILEIYRFGQHAFNALYPNKSVIKRLPSFTLYLAYYHPQMLLNVVRSRAKLAGTDIFSDKWLAKEQVLRDLVRKSLYTPTFVHVTFNQTVNGPSGETVFLDHYSTTGGLTELDPLKMGTGARSSRSEMDSTVKRTYFYRAGTTPENVVVKDPKVKHRYVAELAPHQALYDLAVDPSGIIKKSIEDNDGVANADAFLNAIKDAGYAGYFNSKAGRLSNVVALFNAQAVTEVTNTERKIGVTPAESTQPAGATGDEGGFTNLFSANPPQVNAAAIAAAAQQVAAAFNSLDQASWQDIVADIRRAVMLSGLRTHLGNVISNTAFQIVEEAARYPAVAVDMLARLRYGQRSITVGDNIKSIIHAFSLADTPNIGGSADPESLEKARKAGLRRFTDELFGVSSNTANSQTSSNSHGWNRDNRAVAAIETITNAVFKTLQAEDAVFHAYAMRRHLLDLARVAVKNGEAASQAAFLANLTEADIDQANADALMATFNNNNALSTGISNLKSSLSEHGGLGAYSKLAVELIVPFDRTPTNIIGRMFDYTPLGAVFGSGGRHEREMVLSSGDYVPSNIISKIKALEGLRKERLLGAANVSDRDIRVLQREAAKQLGRGSVGTIILLGAIFGRLGTIMGLGDDDDRDRNEATGAQKGSMLIGGRWINLNRMQPIGSLLVLGATIQQSLQREATGGGVVSDIAMASLKQLMQIPSLRGFSDFGKATDDENKLESFTGRMIASFIPAIIKDIADAKDSLQRDTKDQSIDVGGAFSLPVGPAMAAIPGLRETLPAKKDFLGRDLPEDHWAQAFFDPFNTSPSRSSGLDPASIGKQAKDDPVFRELDRLDVNITKPKRLAGESEEDYVQRLRVTGTAAYRAVEKQIATQEYKDAAGLRSKSGRVKQKEWLENRIEDAKREATSKLKKWKEAQGGEKAGAKEPEFPWEVEATEKKGNKKPSKPSVKSMMRDAPERPEGFG